MNNDENVVKRFEETMRRQDEFCNAAASGNAVDLIRIFHDEILAHVEDLADKLNDPVLKTEMILGAIELKQDLGEKFAAAKAIDEYRKGSR